MTETPMSGGFRGGVHVFPIRVYYEDTDFSGVVYHANFLRFLERGRSESLRSVGVDHAALAARAEPLAFVVRHIDIAFLKPARIDDALEVRTSYERIAGARLVARQDVFRRQEHLVEARVEVVCIAMSGRPRRMPADLAKALSRHQKEA